MPPLPIVEVRPCRDSLSERGRLRRRSDAPALPGTNCPWQGRCPPFSPFDGMPALGAATAGEGGNLVAADNHHRQLFIIKLRQPPGRRRSDVLDTPEFLLCCLILVSHWFCSVNIEKKYGTKIFVLLQTALTHMVLLAPNLLRNRQQ